MNSDQSPAFWQFDSTYWFQKLGSTPEGLMDAIARQRALQEGGFQKPVSPFEKDLKLLFGQFKSPLMLLLIGAVVLSAFLGDTSDVFIILFIILSTTLMSFWQERKAGRVVERLQSLIAVKSLAWRAGQTRLVPAQEIVKGDVLLFKAGDMIPADCLLIEANELYANEASLTGESFPVRKEPGIQQEGTELSKRINCLWQGTNIVSGSGRALVIQTGSETIFNTIAKSISTANETRFEKGIADFGYFLMKITLVLSIFILIINLLSHKSVIESVLFALALAVGMAPELLPAITTIAMSAGAKRLLAQKVIVKKLSSVQNLGEVNLLCTDKTGTITEGVIEIAGVVNALGGEDAFARELAWWNAGLESGYANPIDTALKQMSVQPVLKAEKTGEVPYDFIRKRLSIAVKTPTENLLISKGAYKEIRDICTKVRLPDGSTTDIAPHSTVIEENYTKFGEEGLRSIAIAYRHLSAGNATKADETDMILAGFVLLQDPVKSGIPDAIHALRKLKVDMKIITGDNLPVARSIALKIGIKNAAVMTGAQLIHTSPEALPSLVKRTHVFAEVEPQQKERLIQALRKTYTVAYMGDGINDVAALHAADVGISVENAVDVAREAADFVLMEKNLSVIADGIREGRKTFANTLKYIYINTGSTFGNMFSVAAASLLLPFLPMLPKQILLTNFITDFPYLSVASDEVDEEQIKSPGILDMKSVRNYMVIFGIHSSLFDVFTFAVLFYFLQVTESAFQTGWFVESVVSELFILFIVRTHKNFVKSRPARSLFLLSVLGFLLTIALPYMPFAAKLGFVPLPPLQLGAMLLIVAAYIITADLLKVWFFKKHM